MEWFYFDNIMPIHAKELIIDNNISIMMPVIKKSLSQFKIIMGSRKGNVSTTTLKFIYFEKKVTLKPNIPP